MYNTINNQLNIRIKICTKLCIHIEINGKTHGDNLYTSKIPNEFAYTNYYKKNKENHNYSLKDTYLNVDKTYSI